MRAIILGGTGAIGGATAARFAAAGWDVDVTGRDHASMPGELAAVGVRFHSIPRSDVHAIERLVGAGAEVLVDLLAYRGTDVEALLPALSSVACPVLVSGRAVYVDPVGRHLNGDVTPRFPGPISEQTPTLPPAGDGVDPFTREGYAPSKVAAEQVALNSGLPFTVIRPSKVHGRWARNPRTRFFIERMLRGDDTIALAHRGATVDHLTAATNTAVLIAAVAAMPEARVLNSADPDTPTAEQIVQVIAARLGWSGSLNLLAESPDPNPGAHPWFTPHPLVLETAASERLGYQPVGTSLELLEEEIDWVVGELAHHPHA
ncbi:nucleoside-diphosphate-sugar epimerase [Arthrobacter sp. CAN_A212]|uniref:nucleoside-diphosphate sugar epimerase n=1 Tax=unclassified Arthrobacter TaxID=235627 RepID=UPI0018C91C5B|nr:nucleoside-diphosphate sugar epimerase [Arthrobacter sp. CAN_C5]MBP2216852.1 nucleoside-diphosphate-sugar epimerase [Arthrobacter sp. CAN_C5]